MARPASLSEVLQGSPSPDEEKNAMDSFLLQHAQRYDFSHDHAGDDFVTLFRLLIVQRFLTASKQQPPPPRDHQLRVLQCMRVLMRDPAHRSLFVELHGTEELVRLLITLATEHTTQAQADFASEMLVETLSILKRFASVSGADGQADELRLQRALVALLSTRSALVLQCVLVAMHQLVQVDTHLSAIGQLGCAETLLHIITDYEPSFKALAAGLVEILLRERTFFQDIVLHDGVAVILSVLHLEELAVQLPLLRTLEKLVAHAECAREIRHIGGINVLLALIPTPTVPRAVVGALCGVLTTLALDDDAALQIRKANGVYLLGQLLLHEDASTAEPLGLDLVALGGAAEAATDGGEGRPEGAEPPQVTIAAHIFRTLRFVFSMERNRKIFRRLFPPELFAAFIDLGHYVRDLERYLPLAHQLGRLSAETRTRMQEALVDINTVKGPSREYIKEYAVQELLGKGAFGSVFQVKKDTGETLYAMKELPLEDVSGSDGSPDETRAGGSLKREVMILSTLQHPNIIRYYESFEHGRSLYIVMELVEGATLLDHLNSLSEKGQRMPQTRIWSIFTQICLALRYIHKERQVVHRDLTPSNVMISSDDVVKLADFGLARQRSSNANSVMDSVVGTILYQCPEIIQNEAYTEKADVWSLGCILYQLATLRPPFEGGNPLVVAGSIVEGKYPPIEGEYEPLLTRVVARLLTVDEASRPDIDDVAALISPVLMAELGRVSKAEHTLRTEVHIERDWRQRHEREASRNKEAVHRLFARHPAPPSRANSLQRESVEVPSVRRGTPARSPMLSISSSRIREIHDPCSRILNQLHKILFICQLPPSMEGEFSSERQLIERYKRELFSQRNHYRGRNLKDELHKLMSGSQEVIDLAFRSAAGTDGDGVSCGGLSNSMSGSSSNFDKKPHVSYEDLQRSIEQVLAETGYYALHTTNGAEAPAAELSTAPFDLVATCTPAARSHPTGPGNGLEPLGAVRLRAGPDLGSSLPRMPSGMAALPPVQRSATPVPDPHPV